MGQTARTLRLFAIAWAARSFVDASFDIYGWLWGTQRWSSFAWSGKVMLSLALAAFAAGVLVRADVDRRVRIFSAVIAGLLVFRALPFVATVVEAYGVARIVDLLPLACVYATAIAGRARIHPSLGIVAVVGIGLVVIRGWLPAAETYFASEWRNLLFTAATIAVAAWGVLVPLDAASQIDPDAKKEDPEDVTGRRVAIGLGAWLLAAALFVAYAIYLATEKMPTYSPFYVDAFAGVVASVSAVALVGPAEEVKRRTVCIAAAIAWAVHAVSLHLAVRFAHALLWDAMDGRDVATNVAIAGALAKLSWVTNIAGIVLTSATLQGFARRVRRDDLARIALAASFPLVVGIVLQIMRPGERPRAAWVDLGFAGCSVLTFGMLAFVAYRILSPAQEE